jgi:hypothetical protein
MEIEFSGPVWFWKGPAPHHFVTVPDEDCGPIEAVSAMVSYGWGMIPAAVKMGGTEFSTALFPKEGGYIVPLKAAARRAEGVEVDDVVTIRLTIDV